MSENKCKYCNRPLPKNQKACAECMWIKHGKYEHCVSCGSPKPRDNNPFCSFECCWDAVLAVAPFRSDPIVEDWLKAINDEKGEFPVEKCKKVVMKYYDAIRKFSAMKTIIPVMELLRGMNQLGKKQKKPVKHVDAEDLELTKEESLNKMLGVKNVDDFKKDLKGEGIDVKFTDEGYNVNVSLSKEDIEKEIQMIMKEETKGKSYLKKRLIRRKLKKLQEEMIHDFENNQKKEK